MLRRHLKRFLFSRGFHLRDQLFQQRCCIAVEHPPHRFYSLVVTLAVDARARTQTDVHREAALGEQFLAVANAKLSPQQLHHLFGSTCIGKRPPLFAALRGVTGVHDSGKFLVGHGEVREGLAVLEHRVEPRHVFANQLAFQHQRSLRRLGHDAFDVVGSFHEFGNHVSVRIGRKVRAYPLVQPRCFPDIEHTPLLILEQVHARFTWQISRSQVHGHAVSTKAVTQKGNPRLDFGTRLGMIDEGGAPPLAR